MNPKPAKSRLRIVFWGVFLGFLLDVVLLFGLLTQFIVGTVWHLGAGWVFAVGRIARANTISAASFLMFLAAVVVSIALGHLLVRWIGKSGTRFRSTLLAAGIFWVAIFSGMALGAAVHQLGWFFGSKNSWFESSWENRPSRAYQYVMFMLRRSEQEPMTLETWKDIVQTDWVREVVMIVPFADSDGRIHTVAARLRDGEKFKRLGGMLFVRNRPLNNFSEESLSAEKFDEWLAAQAR